MHQNKSRINLSDTSSSYAEKKNYKTQVHFTSQTIMLTNCYSAISGIVVTLWRSIDYICLVRDIKIYNIFHVFCFLYSVKITPSNFTILMQVFFYYFIKYIYKIMINAYDMIKTYLTFLKRNTTFQMEKK